jgi:hypothetical protein
MEAKGDERMWRSQSLRAIPPVVVLGWFLRRSLLHLGTLPGRIMDGEPWTTYMCRRSAPHQVQLQVNKVRL